MDQLLLPLLPAGDIPDKTVVIEFLLNLYRRYRQLHRKLDPAFTDTGELKPLIQDMEVIRIEEEFEPRSVRAPGRRRDDGLHQRSPLYFFFGIAKYFRSGLIPVNDLAVLVGDYDSIQGG